jgi:hypothetical protein
MRITRTLAAVVLIAVALLTIISCSAGDKKLTFNGGDLYYTPQVTEADAKKLGNYLVDDKFFDGTQKTVKLNKSEGTYEFRMVLKDVENDRGAPKRYSIVARQMSEQVFNGQKVIIHLCDDKFKTIHVAGGN